MNKIFTKDVYEEIKNYVEKNNSPEQVKAFMGEPETTSKKYMFHDDCDVWIWGSPKQGFIEITVYNYGRSCFVKWTEPQLS